MLAAMVELSELVGNHHFLCALQTLLSNFSFVAELLITHQWRETDAEGANFTYFAYKSSHWRRTRRRRQSGCARLRRSFGQTDLQRLDSLHCLPLVGGTDDVAATGMTLNFLSGEHEQKEIMSTTTQCAYHEPSSSCPKSKSGIEEKPLGRTDLPDPTPWHHLPFKNLCNNVASFMLAGKQWVG